MKNQQLTVLNKPHRLEWCTSMLQRLGEAKRLWGASRKTRKTRRFSCHCSLGFITHLKLSFLFGFLWFLSVSLAVFSLLYWFFGVIYRTSYHNFMRRNSCSCFVVCSCFLTCFTEIWRFSPVSRLLAHGDNGLASRRQLLQKCSSATSSGPTSPSSSCASSQTIRTRGSVGVSHVSQLCQHMFFSQSLARAWLHHHIIFKPLVERRVRYWRILGQFVQPVHSQGFGCRAALQRTMRLTMTSHHCD